MASFQAPKVQITSAFDSGNIEVSNSQPSMSASQLATAQNIYSSPNCMCGCISAWDMAMSFIYEPLLTLLLLLLKSLTGYRC
jgi:hypothetical protein